MLFAALFARAVELLVAASAALLVRFAARIRVAVVLILICGIAAGVLATGRPVLLNVLGGVVHLLANTLSLAQLQRLLLLLLFVVMAKEFLKVKTQ